MIVKAFDDAGEMAAQYAGPVVVIHGGAAGADSLCELEARRRGWHTAVVRSVWGFYGKRAGHVRNGVMNYLDPHEGMAFTLPCAEEKCRDLPPHITHGTAGCMKQMRAAGIEPREYPG